MVAQDWKVFESEFGRSGSPSVTSNQSGSSQRESPGRRIPVSSEFTALTRPWTASRAEF